MTNISFSRTGFILRMYSGVFHRDNTGDILWERCREKVRQKLKDREFFKKRQVLERKGMCLLMNG